MTHGKAMDYTNVPTNTRKPVVGESVWTWWDTGAFGVTPLDGVVVKSGPRTFTVEWQSGIRNCIARSRHDVWFATPEAK